MSVAIATLGMFTPSVGFGAGGGGGSTLVREEPKPSIRVKNLKIDNKLNLKDKDFIKIKYVE
jgi:hypothetical protein